MKLVLLSGGSGKRLWPLSNDSRSKQFLKLLNSDGKKQSMVQRVWGQLKTVGLDKSSIIATSKPQVEMIKNQLGSNVPIVVEPERRDTFPAIALAATYLYSVEETSLEEIVGILPVDPFVEDRFFTRVKELEQLLLDSDTELALIGVRPTFPSSKYGYIVPKEDSVNGRSISVSHFKEKPSEGQALELINQNALWNCGVFAFKLDYIISMLLDKGLPIQYHELLEQYEQLEKTSFDYEVVEHSSKIEALSYDGYWKDLGTWNTLTEEMNTKILGNGVVSEDSLNTHLINELDIPVTVLGIPNAIVAASPDGILVSEKSASPRIKEFIGDFNQRPMYEERKWGSYKVLDYTKLQDSTEVLTKRLRVKTGESLNYQQHFKRTEVWTVIKGEAKLVLDDEIQVIKAGDVVKILPEVKHALLAISEIEIIEVQSGSELIEEDICRIATDWNEIEQLCKQVI